MYQEMYFTIAIVIAVFLIITLRLWWRLHMVSSRFKALVNSKQYPVLEVDRNGRVLRAFSRPPQWKYGKIEDWGTFNIADYIESAEEVKMRKQLLAHCIDRKTTGAITVHTKTLDGKRRVINLSIAWCRGGVAVETSVDVTEYVEDKSKQDARYRVAFGQVQLMLKSAGAMPWVLGPEEECNVIGDNRATLPVEYQGPPEDVVHLQDNDFASIDEEFRDMVRGKIADMFAGKIQSAVFEFKGKILKSQKKSIWFRSNCMPLTVASDGTVISLAGTTKIIDKEKQAALEMKRAKERAEYNDHMKSLFLSAMSHEVRTPLNVILGFAKLLPSASEEEAAEYEKLIDSNGELLLNLVNDVLDMSRIETGEFKVVKNRFEINAVCDMAVSSLMSKNREGVALSFCRTLPDTEIVGDAKRIMQVLMQLVGNALKYTYSGSITVRLVHEEPSFVKILVEDTGEGISQENLKRVFDRFFRANTQELGNGLGLTICKSLVCQMGGKIGVESKLGVGSTFWFTVPVA